VVVVPGLYPTDVDKHRIALLEAAKMSTGILLGGAGIFTLYLTARRQHRRTRTVATRGGARHTLEAFEHTVATTGRSRILVERVLIRTNVTRPPAGSLSCSPRLSSSLALRQRRCGSACCTRWSVLPGPTLDRVRP
jgi:hypothetical protein